MRYVLCTMTEFAALRVGVGMFSSKNSKMLRYKVDKGSSLI